MKFTRTFPIVKASFVYFPLKVPEKVWDHIWEKVLVLLHFLKFPAIKSAISSPTKDITLNSGSRSIPHCRFYNEHGDDQINMTMRVMMMIIVGLLIPFQKLESILLLLTRHWKSAACLTDFTILELSINVIRKHLHRCRSPNSSPLEFRKKHWLFSYNFLQVYTVFMLFRFS